MNDKNSNWFLTTFQTWTSHSCRRDGSRSRSRKEENWTLVKKMRIFSDTYEYKKKYIK